MSSLRFILFLRLLSVQCLRWSAASFEEASMFGQISASERANMTSATGASNGVVASLLRDTAPHLYSDSQIRKMIEQGPRLGPVKDLPELTGKRRIMSMHDM